MYYTDVIAPTYYRREIQSNDEDGGIFLVNQSTFFPDCFDGVTNHFLPMDFYFLDDCSDINSITINYPRNSSISIYPNPSNGFLSIEILENYSKNYKLEIYNTIGEEVFESHINNKETEINVSYLPSGIYMLRIINVDKIIYFNKLIIK